MFKFRNIPEPWRQVISYSAVAVGSAILTAVLLIIFGTSTVVNYSGKGNYSQGLAKLEKIYGIIQEQYIGETNEDTMVDAAAQALVLSTGDRWSYYMNAEEYAAYLQTIANADAGIGVTINSDQMDKGLLVESMDQDGGAAAAGVQVGDWITHVEGQAISGMTLSDARSKIRGQSGTTVKVTVDRNGTKLDFTITRGVFAVAKGQLLDGNIGLITIVNFNEKASDETIKLIEELKNKGATALIFDVRGNPGGSSMELSKTLDYILPKDCILFQSVSYDGEKQVIRSDERYMDIPIAVLIDENSYSAAELFAATLVEYNKAFTVGQHTTGKGRYQVNIPLEDGSAVHLSIGKYTTPLGVDLGAVGGIAPTHAVELTKDQATKLSSGTLDPEDDPQVQKAVEELLKKGN